MSTRTMRRKNSSAPNTGLIDPLAVAELAIPPLKVATRPARRAISGLARRLIGIRPQGKSLSAVYGALSGLSGFGGLLVADLVDRDSPLDRLIGSPARAGFPLLRGSLDRTSGKPEFSLAVDERGSYLPPHPDQRFSRYFWGPIVAGMSSVVPPMLVSLIAGKKQAAANMFYFGLAGGLVRGLLVNTFMDFVFGPLGVNSQLRRERREAKKDT